MGVVWRLWLKAYNKYGPLPKDTMDDDWADAIQLGNSGQYAKAPPHPPK